MRHFDIISTFFLQKRIDKFETFFLQKKKENFSQTSYHHVHVNVIKPVQVERSNNKQKIARKNKL